MATLHWVLQTPRLSILILGSLPFLGMGCNQPCVGLDCSTSPPQRDILVFLQAESTTPTRLQSGATLSVHNSTPQKEYWSVHFSREEEELHIVGNGEVYALPSQIGTLNLEEPTVINPFSQGITFSSWLVTANPFLNSTLTDDILNNEETGGIQLYNGDMDLQLTLLGDTRLQQLPSALWRCGDLDGDNQDDWIASDLGTDHTGRIWLGLSTIWQNLVGVQPISVFPQLSGDLSNEGFGHSVLCNRDWNQDGTIDIVVGSPFANINGVVASGRIQLFENVAGEFTEIASIYGTRSNEWTGYRLASGQIDGDQDLELLSTSFESKNTMVKMWTFGNGDFRSRYTLRSKYDGTFFGYAIHVADTNGDNLDDVLIGEPYYSSSKYTECGLLHRYAGTKSLLDWNEQPNQILGTDNYGHLGAWIDSADINQDGYSDILLQTLVVE